jgi:hypothetical protein
MSINDISRAMIKKYREKHGSCLLGVLNKKHGEGSMFVPYTGQKVFNFEFDFAVPYPDGQLSDMLTEYCAPKKEYSSQNVYRSIQAILSRIEEIGGLYLMWA